MDPKRRADLEAKIRALGKLAAPGSGATVDEAMLAAAKMAELMEKYNIEELAEIADLDPTAHEEYDFYHRDPWRMSLITAVGRLSFCNIVRTKMMVPQKKGNGYKDIWRITIIGTAMNRKSTIMLFEYLEEAIKRGSRSASHAESFKIGASGRVCARLYEMINARSEKDSPAKANLPVVVEKHAARNLEYQNLIFGELKTIKFRRQRGNLTDFNSGREFGDKLNLIPLSNGEKVKRIQ